MDPRSREAEIIVVGGGPSGAVAASLLASWGHDVRLLTRVVDAARSLANSLPPSTRKILQQTATLPFVERVGYRTTGNTVWWGDRAGDVEPFDADGRTWGYQVERDRLDPLLLKHAEACGASVTTGANVQAVRFGDGAHVTADVNGTVDHLRARLLLDCSGRVGVVARAAKLRRHVTGGRMQALVGVWRRDSGWTLENPSHTFIETCDEGWAWSIPVSEHARHIGLMVDGPTSRIPRGRSIASTYQTQLARTPRLAAQAAGATLERAFACDASIYGASEFTASQFLLVGDAGSTLNPLSSFGVKKALASAWLAAVVAHTRLTHPERTAPALRFFARWERQVWHANLQRSREFAREALARHAGPFWESQASLGTAESPGVPDDNDRLARPEVLAAIERLRHSQASRLERRTDRPFMDAPVVRGRTIVLEPAVPCVGDPEPIRYFRGIDLVEVINLLVGGEEVPALFDRYCARHAGASLPDFLAALALLVASDMIVVQG